MGPGVEIVEMRPLICLALFSVVVHAGDRDFDHAVRIMESEYGQKRMYIPFFGVANFFVKTIRPAGARDVKLAVFEDVDSRRHPSDQRIDEIFTSMLAQGWSRFVRVQSRNGERVHIYSRRVNKNWELFVATLEDNEAVMVRVRVNPDGLAKWVNNPLGMACRKGAD
jgi:plasmid maintenance system killer protein